MTLYRTTVEPSNPARTEAALSLFELIEDGVLVPVEPNGRICTVHENAVPIQRKAQCNLWRRFPEKECVMVDAWIGEPA